MEAVEATESAVLADQEANDETTTEQVEVCVVCVVFKFISSTDVTARRWW